MSDVYIIAIIQALYYQICVSMMYCLLTSVLFCLCLAYKARGDDWKKLQSLLAQLRKAANHPYVHDIVLTVLYCTALHCAVL